MKEEKRDTRKEEIRLLWATTTLAIISAIAMIAIAL